MARYYIAYGSNLNVAQMRHRCPGAKAIGVTAIQNCRLLFRGSKSGNYLTIEPAAGRKVPVAVWEVTERDELSLDIYEGYPRFYRKETVQLKVGGETADAFVYIMNGDRPVGRPTNTYLETCATGYRDFGFDETILAKALEESDAEELPEDPDPIYDFDTEPYGWGHEKIVREN